MTNNNSWNSLFKKLNNDLEIKNLFANIKKMYQQNPFGYLPKEAEIFNAFNFCDYKKIKVIILGQEPYPNKKDAHGLAFSSQDNKVPASLKNIFKAVKRDYPQSIFKSANLMQWSQQGVFLINAILTIENGKSNSHLNLGWQYFSNKVLQHLNDNFDNLVIICWGKHAEKLATIFDQKKHKILIGAHPSPLSAYRGFFDISWFKIANDYLIKTNQSPIDWSIY